MEGNEQVKKQVQEDRKKKVRTGGWEMAERKMQTIWGR